MENRISKVLISACFVILTGITGFSANVNAADAITPANEGVCDSLQGATPGLYGLCVAYCEAQDLDVINKEPPNTKILDNYKKKMQPGDPGMPCVQPVDCPCWSAEQAAAMYGDGVIFSCDRTSLSIEIQNDAGSRQLVYSDTYVSRSGYGRCAYKNLDASPPTAYNFRLTAEEAQSCYAPLAQACDDLEIIVTP